MKVAIVGSSGYIAGFLIEALKRKSGVGEIMKIDQTHDADELLDLREPKKFSYNVLDEVDYVIFTAAVSGPDQCAKEIELCWQINVEGTKYLSRRL